MSFTLPALWLALALLCVTMAVKHWPRGPAVAKDIKWEWAEFKPAEPFSIKGGFVYELRFFPDDGTKIRITELDPLLFRPTGNNYTLTRVSINLAKENP